MSTILTNNEIDAAWEGTTPSGYGKSRYDIARAVIAAYEAKLAQQEPVAHRYRFGDVWMFDTYRWNGQDADEVVPVYEHPAPLKDEHSPCMGTNCGKTRYDQEHSAECIAETAKSQGWDTHPAPQQADVQAQQLAVLLDVRNSVVNNRCDGDTDFADGVEAANRNLLVRIDHMIKRTRQGYTHPVEETHAAEWPFAAAPEAPAQASAVDERAAFEAELRRQCFQKPTTEARDLAWCMWQARAALAQKGGAA